MKSILALDQILRLFVIFLPLAIPAIAADTINGRVLGAGAPIANSTVTLWEASADAPKQVGQTKTGADGRFEVNCTEGRTDTVLYLTAAGGEAQVNKGSGDNAAIVLLSVLGGKPPAEVTINEFTTVRPCGPTTNSLMAPLSRVTRLA